ncbi:tetratricopeptide repeat protein [Streptomyces sp. NPDC058308]|uniref:tetratricopeptide repeat protein n=1 Tax=Streptomyces sp. NPDC058308 TaxID=3346440 RepID=UPI0036E3AA89
MDVDRVVRIVPRAPAPGSPDSPDSPYGIGTPDTPGSPARPHPSGTGYLVAPRLVLTAAHLVPDTTAEATPCVTTAGDPHSYPYPHPHPHPYTTTLRWTTARTGALDGGPDAALLEITDPAWQPPGSFLGRARRRPQRWGRLVTDTMGQPVCCHGFARVQRDARDGARLEQLSARINPLSGFPAPRYELTGATGPFGAARGADSPWAGLSGAAVFTAEPTRTPGELRPGELLLGVVRADRGAATGVRLAVTRAEDLLRDPEFRAVVSEHNGGLPPEPEAAELVGLLAPAAAQRDLKSPLTVLRADVEAVAFRGREEELGELRRWCVADDSVHQVATLVGPGGQGKSRIARELAAGLRGEGWVAGRLRHETVRGGGSLTTADALRPLHGVVHPTLVIVDYAETRPDLVRQLIGLADSARDRFRVLLLARSVGAWVDTALGRSALAYGMRDSAPEFVLRPLYTAPGPAAKAFRLALTDLAQVLGQVPPGAHRHGDVDWSELAARISTPPLDDGRETPLSLQMRALEALLGHAAGDPVRATSRSSVEPALLDHEASYWSSTSAALGFDADHDVDDARLLRRAVAAATLCGAVDRAEGRTTLARLPHPGPVPVDKLDRWLGTLYPAAPGRHWGALHPDRVAEFQASAEVVEDPELLPALLDGASDEQWTNAFTVLTRAVVAHTNESRPDAARAVLALLDHVLDHIDRAPLGLPALRACSEALPNESHVLSRLALRVAEVLVERHARATPAGARPPTDAERAGDLHNLAHHLRVTSHWADAVQTSETALHLRENLARQDPETYESDLAASCELSARTLSQVRMDVARHRIDRALLIQRRLHREDPEQHRLQLVRCLRTACYIQWYAGDRDESARLGDEAAGLSRLLEVSEPGRHLGLLTHILDSQSINHWHAKRFPDAISVTSESLHLLGEQMAVNPDAHAPSYAAALHSQALNYDSTGRTDEAVVLCRQAVEIYRGYAADYPEMYERLLGQALHNLALIERDRGDREASLGHMREAADLRRALCSSAPGARSSRGSGASSSWLGCWLRDDDRLREAVAAFREAVAAHRAVLAAEPGPDTRAELASELERLGRCQELLSASAAGERAENDLLKAAMAALRESVTLYRSAAAGSPDPEAYDDELWVSVDGLARCYRQAGHAGPQRVLLRAALPMLRRRAAQEPARRSALASCLADLGEAYRETTYRRQGLLLLEEAVALEEAVVREAGPEAAVANLRAYLVRLRESQYQVRRYAAAARSAERVVPLVRHEHEKDSAQAPPLGPEIVQLARAYSRTGRCAEAERLAAEGVAVARRAAAVAEPAHRITATLRLQAETLLECARRTGSMRTARAALAPAQEALAVVRHRWTADPGAHAWELRDTALCLADVLDGLGRRAEAADVRDRLAPPPAPARLPLLPPPPPPPRKHPPTTEETA